MGKSIPGVERTAARSPRRWARHQQGAQCGTAGESVGARRADPAGLHWPCDDHGRGDRPLEGFEQEANMIYLYF